MDNGYIMLFLYEHIDICMWLKLEFSSKDENAYFMVRLLLKFK
jgi:hypothetical protein